MTKKQYSETRAVERDCKLPSENILLEEERRRNLDRNMHSVGKRIVESGLFDPDFYVKTYGENLAGEHSPIEHFLGVGLGRGYLPSTKFDPVLYRMRTPSCGRTNPLLHYLDNHAGDVAPSIDLILPDFIHISKNYADGSAFVANVKKESSIVVRFTKAMMCNLKGEKKTLKDYVLDYENRNRACAHKTACERNISFAVGTKKYTLKVPPANFFLDRIRSGAPFAFARLPHGFWEAIVTLVQIERELKSDPRANILTEEERRVLAVRIGMALLPHHGAFTEAFISEVLGDIKSYSYHPDFFWSVAFKGFPTWDEGLFPYRFSKNDQKERLAVFAQFFEPFEPLFDATLWKRLLISGELKELPELCRHRHVILVASDIFSELGNRWALERFSHIPIPRALSQRIRRELLEKIKKAVDEAVAQSRDRPIVLMQCGGSLSFWLIRRLFDYQPKVFYIDLGQALNGWFFDSKELTELAWMTTYKPSIIENCSLGSYYSSLKAEGE